MVDLDETRCPPTRKEVLQCLSDIIEFVVPYHDQDPLRLWQRLRSYSVYPMYRPGNVAIEEWKYEGSR